MKRTEPQGGLSVLDETSLLTWVLSDMTAHRGVGGWGGAPLLMPEKCPQIFR